MEENNMQEDNDGRNPIGDEEDIAVRRNQVLMFGVVLLGILAICLAVSMPSDLEFDNSAITTHDSMSSEKDETNTIFPTTLTKNNTTNSTFKNHVKNSEDSVENKILRNIAIQKVIKGIHNNEDIRNLKINNNNDDITSEKGGGDGTKENQIQQIVQSFMETEEFENFIIDIEIHDAIKRLRKEKRYKKKDNTIFDDIFKEIERHFLGDDPEEVQIIRSVGEEMEKRAREIINERKNNDNFQKDKELIANELYYSEDYEEDSESSEDNKD